MWHRALPDNVLLKMNTYQPRLVSQGVSNGDDGVRPLQD